MFRRSIFLGVLAMAFATSGVAAQAGGMHGMGQHRMDGRGGPMNMLPRLQSYGPAPILERRAELELTNDQVAQLTTIEQQMNETMNESRAIHDAQQAELQQAIESATFDQSTISAHFWTAHAAMGRMHWAEVEASLKVYALLSVHQREMIDGM